MSPLEGHCHLELVNETPAFATHQDDEFLQQVCATSGFPEAIGVNYGTDAGRLVALGCRSVVFGPGDIAQAHRANEWIPLDEFERMPVFLGELIDVNS
jgi:acetylornithine deacetylase